MATSEFAKAVDSIQSSLRPLLKERGFKVRGRSFNCTTEDGLTQVVNFQMGQSDPPGTTYIPGLRENLHGLFTINLGVYIPEVAAVHGGGIAKSWVQDYQCSIRDRLGHISGSEKDIWWQARVDPEIVHDLQTCLVNYGFPFLNRFANRDSILAELHGEGKNLSHCSVPRIVCAIIRANRHEVEIARELLSEQAKETWNPRHPDYVRGLAQRMGLGLI
jgi:hypothetical protein